MESTKYELIQLNSGDFVALPVLTCPLPRLASIGLRKGQTLYLILATTTHPQATELTGLDEEI